MNNLKNDSRYYGYMDMQPSPTREQVHERVYQRAGMHIVQSEIFYIFWFAIFNRIAKKIDSYAFVTCTLCIGNKRRS